MNWNKVTLKRMALTVVFAILILILYTFIFLFSNQDGDQSSNLSREVTEQMVRRAGQVFVDDLSDWDVKKLVNILEGPVRKLGHLTEYCLLGILVYSTVTLWLQKSRLRTGLMFAWIILSATADEVHQLFVGGRSGRPLDILIDTLGACIGFLICQLILKIAEKMKKRPKDS